MKFEYELTGKGWADVFIEINGKEKFMQVSYLTNALGNLTRGLLYLIPGCVPEDEVRNKSSFKWHFEPAGVMFAIESVDKKALLIEIKEFRDMFKKDDEGKIILRESCSLVDFIEVVVKTLDKIIKKYGIIGYKNTWYDFDFPISNYLKLKHYLIYRKSFLCEKKVEDGYKEFQYSILDDEIKLLFAALD